MYISCTVGQFLRRGGHPDEPVLRAAVPHGDVPDQLRRGERGQPDHQHHDGGGQTYPAQTFRVHRSVDISTPYFILKARQIEDDLQYRQAARFVGDYSCNEILSAANKIIQYPAVSEPVDGCRTCSAVYPSLCKRLQRIYCTNP